jgi:signal transduction histidine kinase
MRKRWREHGWRLLPGLVTALVIGCAVELTLLAPLEQIAYRTLFRVRGERPWDERLVLIAIDDESIQQIGRFPWPRQYYARLLQQLNQSEPALVVINLLWSETSPDDGVLAEAMLENGRVVLPLAWDANGELLPPVAALQDAAIATGHIAEYQDSDGLVRWILASQAGYPAMGIAAAQAYQLVHETLPPVPPDPQFWLNWPASASNLPQYSFLEVVEGEIPAAAFTDKVVLLGVTATGIDPQATPFDQLPLASGVHVHAALLHNLLQRDSLMSLGTGWQMLLLLLGGPGLSWVMAAWNTRQQLVVLSGLCLGWGLFSLLLFQANYLPPVAMPLILFSATALSVALTERLRENALLQRQVDRLWLMHREDLALQTLGDSAADLWVGDEPLPRGLPAMLRVRQLTALAELFARSQSSQAAIARHLSIGLATADLDGQVWFCNPKAAAWLNIQVGKQLQTRLLPDWLSAGQWREISENLRTEGTRSTVEVHLSGDMTNGTTPRPQWFALTLEPLLYRSTDEADPNHICDGVLLVIEDITLHKQIEANLSRQISDLNEVTQLKDDFWSAVSHELRSPLSNIKMAAQILAMNPNPETQQEYLQLIDDECQRELDLISELLDLRRLESGSHSLELDTLDLDAWLHHLLLPFEVRTRDRQQHFECQIASDLPTITTDRFSLERLLVELVNNACKYTPANHTITVAAHATDAWVELVVSNTGITIPPHKLAKIFEKFYRIPDYDHWHQGGTGLGLTLVKRLAEYLGGSVQADSQDQVTTFTVRLPLLPTSLVHANREMTSPSHQV